MVSDTKTLQSKPRSDRKGGSSPKPQVSPTGQDTSKGLPIIDHQHHSPTLQKSQVLHMVPPRESHTSHSQSCGNCSDFSTGVQPSHHHTSVSSQQSPPREKLFISQSGSAQRAHCPPNSADSMRDALHLPMTMDLYSSIERWEAQTAAEDAWSTFVVLENGTREPIGEEVDIVRDLVIEE